MTPKSSYGYPPPFGGSPVIDLWRLALSWDLVQSKCLCVRLKRNGFSRIFDLSCGTMARVRHHGIFDVVNNQSTREGVATKNQHIYIYIYIYARIYAYMRAYMRLRWHICIYIYMYMRAYMRTCVHICDETLWQEP